MTTKEIYDRQCELTLKADLTKEEQAELYAIDAVLDARCE